LLASVGFACADPQGHGDGEALFDPGRVVEIEIEMRSQDWDALGQPYDRIW